MSGKRFLVTGATGSLGGAIALSLARQGASLVLPARDPDKGERLLRGLRAACPAAALTAPAMDLASLSSVDACCNALLASGQPLDGLLHVAGAFQRVGLTTEDGCELHYQLHFLAPMRLTLGLLPALLSADAPVLGAMTSLAAFPARVDWANPQALGVRSATRVYGRSKRLLALALIALAREQPRCRLTLAHPGVSATGLFSPGQTSSAYGAAFLRVVQPVMRRLFMTPAQAARPAVWSATHPLPAGSVAEPRGLWHVWGRPAAVPRPSLFDDLDGQTRALALAREECASPRAFSGSITSTGGVDIPTAQWYTNSGLNGPEGEDIS